MHARPDSDTPAVVPSLTQSGRAERRYRAFISYSHADSRWARWLMRRLEGYRVPERFHGRTAPIGVVGRRIAPVFRDRDELPTTSDLGETIRAALRTSETLVVICSPRSARSRWVHEEIAAFKRMHGERRVFAFIVAGEPKHAGAEDDCFSPALRVEVDADGRLSERPAEVVAADAREAGDGPRLAFVRLVAGLLGVGFDDLRQRELVRRNRRLTLIAAGSAVGMAVTLGLAVTAWQARNDAQRRQDQAEDVLAFMLGDFRADLKKVGQLALLDKVGNKAMEYFETLEPQDLTDTALARQAKALTQIGEIRMDQKDARYAEAGKAFFTAYRRAAALTERHPRNADMLFERAQAEFWIGFVFWRRRELDAAREWLSRYRTSAEELQRVEPAALRAKRESISGHHNLAVLELESGNLESARAGFERALELHRELSRLHPTDRQIQFRVADTLSWLGTVADRGGKLADAEKRYSEQVAAMEALVAADPGTAHWRFKLADARTHRAVALAVSGELDAARSELERAKLEIEKLVATDRANRRWLLLANLNRLNAFEWSWRSRAPRTALADVTRLGDEIVALGKADPKEATIPPRISLTWRWRAEIKLLLGEDGVAEAAEAVAAIESIRANAENSRIFVSSIAEAWITSARVEQARGDVEAMRERAGRALDALQPQLERTHYWRFLDPAVRALTMLGRLGEAKALQIRAEAAGYRPIEPWPPEILSAQ